MRRTLCIGLLVVSVASCSLPRGEGETAWYVDTTHFFRFRYPRKWKRIDVGGTGLVMFTGGANTQIAVSSERGGETAIAAMLTYFRKAFSDYQELDAGWREVNGHRAYFQTARWNTPLCDIAALRLFVPTGDHFFVVTASTPRQEFERYLPLLRACVLSFELTQ